MNDNCNHNAGVTNTNINGGIGGTSWTGYCPYCQPKCPCCGRPYYGGYYPPYNPYQIYYQSPSTCQAQSPNIGQATC